MLIDKKLNYENTNNRRKVAGSESDLIHSLKREDSREVDSNWSQGGRGRRHPPISKSHSDWGLILPPSSVEASLSNNNFQDRPRHVSNSRMSQSRLTEHVYSQPDLTFTSPQFNPNNIYSSATTPSSSSHESFRVC